jgi:hypothetical protein
MTNNANKTTKKNSGKAKLSMSRDTIRRLGERELDQVAGGDTASHTTSALSTSITRKA